VSKRIAVLTGGGHVGSWNAGISGVLAKAKEYDWEVYGSLRGWEGMQEGNFVELSGTEVEKVGLRSRGGSIICSSRTRPDMEKVVGSLSENDIDGVIGMGGDDTLGALADLSEEGVPVAGWPKTMDNDLSETYFCLGYPSAVKEAAQALREGMDTAITHHRILLVTMFGRDSDWVVAGGACYGEADMLIPAETTVELDEIYGKMMDIYERNGSEYRSTKGFATVAIAEGASIEGLESHVKKDEIAMDEFGHPKLSPNDLVSNLSDTVRERSKKEGRAVKTAPMALTYQMRNGAPLKLEEELGAMAGEYCVEMLERGDSGNLAALQYDDVFHIRPAPLEEATEVRMVAKDMPELIDYEEMEVNEEAFLEYGEPFLGGKKERIAPFF